MITTTKKLGNTDIFVKLKYIINYGEIITN